MMKNNERFGDLYNWQNNHKRLLYLGFALLIIAGLIFVSYTFMLYNELSKEQATNLAKTYEAFLPPEVIGNLEAVPDDINKPEYARLKEELTKFVVINDDIRFAYIMVEKEGRGYFLADSEPPDSAAYSPPGQEYIEYTKADLQQLSNKKAVISPLDTDE